MSLRTVQSTSKIWTSKVQLPLLLCKTLSKIGTRLSHRWTEQFSGLPFYVAGFLIVATTENTIQAASTTMSATQLSDIIQQVPQILGHMTHKSRSMSAMAAGERGLIKPASPQSRAPGAGSTLVGHRGTADLPSAGNATTSCACCSGSPMFSYPGF